MRRLAIFSLSFAAAAAAYVWLLPADVALWIALGAGVLFVALRFLRGKMARRACIAALGLAVGLLWCSGYAHFRIEPLQALCGENRELTAEISAYPEQTRYGCRVLARIGTGRIMLYLDEEGEMLSPGDRVKFCAEVVDVSDGGEEENFYFQSRDISLLAFQDGALEIEKVERRPLRVYPSLALQAMRSKITELFPADTEAFMRALLTGDRSGLSYQVRNEMSVTGISHIIAISGMHVSLIIGFLMLLCFQRRRLVAAVGIVTMFFFAAMLDFSPSVTRAVLMNTVLLLAPLLRRENDAPTSLSFALLIILVLNPWAIASLSLQLSFGAMTGIFLLAPRAYQWLIGLFRYDALRERHPLLAVFARTAAVSLSTTFGAMIFTTPRVAAAFGTVSVISPLTNLLIMSVISMIFLLGFVVLPLGFLLSPLGSVAAWMLSWAVRIVLGIVGLLARVPFAAVYTNRIYVVAWLATAYLMIGVFLLLRSHRPLALVLSLTVTLAGTVLFCVLDHAQTSVTALDVGQGQCILLQSNGVNIAVDCGGDSGDEAGETLARELLMSGSSELDALILTHYDSDHVGGVGQLMARLDIGCIFMPDISDDSGNRQMLEREAEERGIPIEYVRVDEEISFAGGSVRLFAPDHSFSDNEGLAALMSVEEYDILITGDMDAKAERELLREHTLPDLEVLVAGHHGSKYSTDAQLLEQTAPEVVVISVGDNSYGHPAQETLDRIAACGAMVFRTDLDGDITILR